MYANKPSAFTPRFVSQPYPPLPPAPALWSLQDAFTAYADHDGHLYVAEGHVRFLDRAAFQKYLRYQRAIGGTPGQLAALHRIIKTGLPPCVGPVASAPSETTVEQLLTGSPSEDGIIRLGTLRVRESDYAKFRVLQTTLCERNREALDLLFHMEHAREDVTFRITDEHEIVERKRNVVAWNPRIASWDAVNGVRISPSTTALREEAHWAAGELGEVLAGIPSTYFGNFEEQRLIEGVEARDLAILGQPRRESYFGNFFPVIGIDSTTPQLSVKYGSGVWESVTPPWSLTGRVLSVDETSAIVATGPEGANRDDLVRLNLQQLSLGLYGIDNARALLANAAEQHDTATVRVTESGGVVYENDQQRRRLLRDALEGFPVRMKYPEPLHLLGEAPSGIGHPARAQGHEQ